MLLPLDDTVGADQQAFHVVVDTAMLCFLSNNLKHAQVGRKPWSAMKQRLQGHEPDIF